MQPDTEKQWTDDEVNAEINEARRVEQQQMAEYFSQKDAAPVLADPEKYSLAPNFKLEDPGSRRPPQRAMVYRPRAEGDSRRLSDVDQAMSELETLVNAIPSGGEWWKQSTQDTFQQSAKKLVELGMPPKDAASFLSELYHATAGEFGS